jgi:D-tyrosyl-tRNA(Tyr) deacylase
MRATVQRVANAKVTVENQITGQIGRGVLVYVGVAPDDTADDVAYLVDKIANLRIFNDEQGKMNLSVRDIGGGVLVISAFTLQADARKGRRPSFDAAAPPELANALYEQLCAALAATGLTVARGVFRAAMEVESLNIGPICVPLDSKRLF